MHVGATLWQNVVGAWLGARLGAFEGVRDGALDGARDGARLGTRLGERDGARDGARDGLDVVGEADGLLVLGAFEGARLGTRDGALEGAFEGALEGAFEGVLDGARDGDLVGFLDGARDGARDGVLDGERDGACVGNENVGESVGNIVGAALLMGAAEGDLLVGLPGFLVGARDGEREGRRGCVGVRLGAELGAIVRHKALRDKTSMFPASHTDDEIVASEAELVTDVHLHSGCVGSNPWIWYTSHQLHAPTHFLSTLGCKHAGFLPGIWLMGPSCSVDKEANPAPGSGSTMTSMSPLHPDGNGAVMRFICAVSRAPKYESKEMGALHVCVSRSEQRE